MEGTIAEESSLQAMLGPEALRFGRLAAERSGSSA